MKSVCHALCAIAVAAFLCSCGSLESEVSFPKLKPGEISYIDSRPDDGGEAMLQTYGKFQVKGSRSASVLYPAFPWFELKTFFKDDSGKGYGLMYIYTLMPVVPLFVGTDGVIYGADGSWRYTHHCSGVPLLYSYTELARRDNSFPSGRVKDWQFDLVDIPYIDGLIGFGNGNFQFLWIPFVSQDAGSSPKANLDLDYKPGSDFR